MSIKLQMSKDLHHLLMMDMPLRPAMLCDFGIAFEQQHSVLQRVVRAGATVEELDDCIGNGDKINALVAKYEVENDFPFKTPYDALRNELKNQIDILEKKPIITEPERLELNTMYEALKNM